MLNLEFYEFVTKVSLTVLIVWLLSDERYGRYGSVDE